MHQPPCHDAENRMKPNPMHTPGGDEPRDDSDERKAYASPVCYAHEFESALAERAAMVPAGVHQLIVEQAAEAVVFADRAGTIRLWNRGAEKLFGHTAAEALGSNLDLIIPERFRAAHWQGYRRAIESGELGSADAVRVTRSQHKDGRKLYLEMSFNLARDATGAVIGSFAIARDVSERHAANAPR
jgi:PAS domain S-box-containing protein